MEKIVVVTGSSGFLGQTLVKILKKHGYSVLEICRKGPVSWDKFWRMDLCKIEAVFHLAAFIPPAMENSRYAKQCREINAGLTLRLAEHVAKRSKARFLFASTGQIYGFSEKPCSEDSPKLTALRGCFYLSSKLLAEEYAKRTAHYYGLNLTILRIANMYGPGMRSASVVAQFVKKAIKSQPLLLFNKGLERYDMIEVTDAAQSFVLALQKKENGIFNVGSGVQISIRKIAQCINKTFNSTAGIKVIEAKKTLPQPGFAALDITLAKTILGIRPVSFDEGIKKYKRYLLKGK